MPANGYPYGAIKQAVQEVIRQMPEGTEFHYGDLAEDLGLQRPTVSGIVLGMARAIDPIVIHGNRSGSYRRVAAGNNQQKPEAEPQARWAESPVGESMEVVVVKQNGNRILRGEDGSAWEASPM
jgi:hypothetical protein